MSYRLATPVRVARSGLVLIVPRHFVVPQRQGTFSALGEKA
jgi:hypothetical protein